MRRPWRMLPSEERSRWRSLRVVVATVLFGAGTITLGCDSSTAEPCQPQRYASEHFDHGVSPGPLPLRCDLFPTLCNLPLESDIHSVDLERAYDIVFTGDGFSRAELSDYRERVDDLIDGMTRDSHGLIQTDPGLFNFHRVDVASSRGSVTNADTTDTELGGCLEHDDLGLTSDWFLSADGARARTAARNAPDADVVVVVVNGSEGRETAAGDVVVLNRDSDHRVLTHELGHALFGLKDEYSDSDACYPFEDEMFVYSTLEPLALVPNLTLDPEAPKWQDLVEGARVGGARFGACVYHPTDGCRMLNVDDRRFCPVCEAHILNTLRFRQDPDFDDGPPICGIGLDQQPTSVSGELWISHKILDGNGVASWELSIDGSVVADGGCTVDRCDSYSGGGLLVSTSDLAAGEHEIRLRCCDHKDSCAVTSVSMAVTSGT